MEEFKIPEGYVRLSDGTLKPKELIKEYDLLKDDIVESLFTKAKDIQGILECFRREAIEEIQVLVKCLEDEYCVKSSSKKGNYTITGIDGSKKIAVASSDFIAFNERTALVQQLLEEYVLQITENSGVEIKEIVARALQVDKEGNFSASKLLPLLQYEFDNETWKKAMSILKESIYVTKAKSYIRFYERDPITNEFILIPLDIAKTS